MVSHQGQKSRALEFGASNLVLARLLSSGFDEVVAVDPLLSGVEGQKSDQNILVSGVMLEQHLRHDFELNDLIVARHTLEHVSNPVEILVELAQRLKPRGKIVFEVPDLDAIVAKGRFDAVFHQHFHYYDLDSLNYFASVSGLRVISWARNAAGSNGGSLIVALEKGRADFLADSERVDSKVSRILKALELFRKMYSVMEENAKQFRGPRYVYGAAIMLPTFDYHMKGSVKDIGLVVDDDEAKVGLNFKNLPVDVVHTSSIDSYEKSMVVIGSLENARSMAARIRELRPLVALGPSIY
jgi:SAM-dependent methyltransferase